MPPSLREWLAEDHLAWFVIEAVEEMDLSEFYAEYRAEVTVAPRMSPMGSTTQRARMGDGAADSSPLTSVAQ
jgi:hypothetical protein